MSGKLIGGYKTHTAKKEYSISSYFYGKIMKNKLKIDKNSSI